MQYVRSANDGSLNPIRDDIEALRRRMDKQRDRQKLLEQKVDALQTILDGYRTMDFPKALIFRKEPMPPEEEEG